MFSPKKILLLCLLSLFFLQCSPAWALSSKYFDVTLKGGVDGLTLAKKLNINYFRHIETITNDDNPASEGMLGRALDSLFLEVSDILDIHIYSLKINLEVFPTRDFVNKEILRCSGKVLDMPSFYYYEKNTIYISEADLRTGMLAHEVAHAIISHYFVIPPPERAQEILSGYVEYSINKLSGN